ncbi:MAG TPA: DUF3108 domain-containing protein [Rhodanobacteraceae bacterium]|nr:DUF3108 domain-containing protein [Rhodanobacteraceae bacterium]
MNTNRLVKIVPVAAALLFAGSVLAAPLPAFTARYQLLQGDTPIGEATMTLAPAGDGAWTFTTDSKGTSGMAALLGADARETSTFRWKGDVPEGLNYDYSMDAAIRHKQRNVRFDWSSNIIVVNDKGEHRYPAQAGTVERHTIVLAIAAELAAGKREFVLPVAVRDRVDLQHFAARGKNAISVPSGDYADAVHVARTDKSGAFDAWFVPGKLPVPVEVSQHDNGDFTLKLQSYETGAANRQ